MDDLLKMLEEVLGGKEGGVAVYTIDENGIRPLTREARKTRVIMTTQVWKLMYVPEERKIGKGEMLEDPNGTVWEVIEGMPPPLDDWKEGALGKIRCRNADGVEQDFSMSLFDLRWDFVEQKEQEA
jgi:hypothetical protein